MNKHTRMIDFEAWPPYVDPHNFHVRQLDNYGATRPFYLSTLKVIGLNALRVKIMNHCGERNKLHVTYQMHSYSQVFWAMNHQPFISLAEFLATPTDMRHLKHGLS